MFQFRLCQDISNLLHDLDKLHQTDMKGYNDTNRIEEHLQWIVIWKKRRKCVLISQPIQEHLEHKSHYMNLYQVNSKVCLTRVVNHPNIAATSCLTLKMKNEQHPPPIVANMHDEGIQSLSQP